MKQYVCPICGYVYDEGAGIPKDGIAPGTRWEDLPENWVCPICKARKADFSEKGQKEEPEGEAYAPLVDKEWNAMEISMICSNLARGCEKQYMPKQAEGFERLALFFKEKAGAKQDWDVEKLLKLLEKDLSQGYPYGMKISQKGPDRGALRSLVWSEKVTRMLKSVLERCRQQGEEELERTGIYVCTVCGFISIGEKPPERCPVCKVPDWKFEKMEGRKA